MNPNTEILLSRLERVRSRGSGRWSARCPAHQDRGPSLSIRDEDGTVLLHCFAGCPVADVVAAVGFELSALFPPRESSGGALPASQRWVPRQALEAVAREALIVAMAADDAAEGRPISQEDADRVRQAAATIRDAARDVGCNV